MGYIPHPSVPLGHLRPYDILLLLGLGAAWELAVRLPLLFLYKRKSNSLKLRELKLKQLEKQVIKSRLLGPQAFVETSKLERQQLAEEKKLQEIKEDRKRNLAAMQKLTRKLDTAVCLVIFILWYGIPIVEFSANRVDSSSLILTEEEANDMAVAWFRAFLFPLSYVGLGIKLSKWGLANPNASIGALLVFWSAQTTVGKIMDGVDALLVI